MSAFVIPEDHMELAAHIDDLLEGESVRANYLLLGEMINNQVAAVLENCLLCPVNRALFGTTILQTIGPKGKFGNRIEELSKLPNLTTTGVGILKMIAEVRNIAAHAIRRIDKGEKGKEMDLKVGKLVVEMENLHKNLPSWAFAEEPTLVRFKMNVTWVSLKLHMMRQTAGTPDFLKHIL